MLAKGTTTEEGCMVLRVCRNLFCYKYVFSIFFLSFVFLFLMPGGSRAASVSLSWQEPATTAIVSGYNVHFGTSSRTYQTTISLPRQSSVDISDSFDEGRAYYFAVTAVDSTGRESAYSNEVYVLIPVADSDGDGISDRDEINIYRTSPTIADTDGDGVHDGDEISFWGTSWNKDFDNDGLVNILDPDSDGDSFSDGYELSAGYDPQDYFSSPLVIVLEAEDGILESPMTIGEDMAASGDAFIEVPNGTGSVMNLKAKSAGSAEYVFSIPETGRYMIWGRVLAASGKDDSFFVSIDGTVIATWHTAQSDTWIWDAVRDGTSPAQPFFLESGEHVLVVMQREDGAKLDQIRIMEQF